MTALGVVAGPVSQSRAAPLPDGRAYELVSPADTGAVQVIPWNGSTRELRDPSSSNLPNSISTDGNSLVFQAEPVPLPGLDSFGGFAVSNYYRAQRGPEGWVTEYIGPPSGSNVTHTKMLATSEDLSARSFFIIYGGPLDPADSDPPGDQSFRDLYMRDASGFTWISRGDLQPPASGEQVSFVGSSSDGSHVAFATNRQIHPEAPPNVQSVYDRTDGQTLLISRRDDGSPFDETPIPHGISPDGSRIVFTTAAPPTRIWMRVGGQTTVEISRSRLAVPETPRSKSFAAMSTDASKIFFTTAERLVTGDTDAGPDVYMYQPGDDPPDSDSLELVSGAGPAAATFVDLVADGSRIYFLSRDQLAGGAVAGQPNLYERSTDPEATPNYVATLDPSDMAPQPIFRTRVTDDGSKLVFVSRKGLTDDDYAGHPSIYVYDAAAESIECASCRPSGEPPVGDAQLINPVLTNFYGRTAIPNATADGSMVFFETTDRIVAADVNDEFDVYRYDATSGDVALISSGTGARGSHYVTNSADGRDVIFWTHDTLVPQDHNGPVRKLYDARIGGGFPVVDPPECAGDDCRETVLPPPFASPGSENLVLPLADEQKACSAAPIGKKQRQRFARTGKLKLKVTAARAGRCIARAKAAIKGKKRTVARARKQVAEGESVRLRLRLSGLARRQLAKGKSLKVRIDVKMKGVAGKDTIRLTLDRKGQK